MYETPRRRTTVTPPIYEISTDQLIITSDTFLMVGGNMLLFLVYFLDVDFEQNRTG
jgi:hypothetical protein